MAQDGLEPEEGYFPPGFKDYAVRELNWSRLPIPRKPDYVYADECPYKDDDLRPGIRWVFWSRQHDYPDRPLYHDNFVGSISDACPSPEVIRENIRLALHKMILDPCLNNALVQFWAPTKTSEGRTFLTTQSQPFALGRTLDWDDRQRLCEYRMEMCRKYNDCFYADAGSGEEQLGVPGRVFLHEFPEFNLDVKYSPVKEYPQRDLALRCLIKGYLALPVCERSSQNCVGVLEISILYPLLPIWGYQKDFLIRHVFDRFQEFGLQCLYGCEDWVMRDDDRDKNNALAVAFKELEMVLEPVCKFHDLALAMTWVPCSTCDHLFQGQHLFHSEDSFSLKNRFFFPWAGFKAMLKACHLRKEQVTGRIHTFPKLSYCSDVKQFTIDEYPLVVTVRHLDLSGCFTMCLQSSRTGSELYVLEFFLPPISKDDYNILTRLSSILRTVEEKSKTFKLACSQEFGGGLAVEVIDFPNGQRSHSIRMIEDTRVFPTLVPLEDGGGMLQLDQPDQPSMDAVNSQMNGVSEARNYNLPSVEPLQNGKVASRLDSSDQSSMDPANNGQDVFTAKRNILEVTSSEESKRKTQKTEHRKSGFKIEVSLEDIIKCKKMSRADAARKLEVSISTLKRVCRDYSINRWPPRNLKNGKVATQNGKGATQLDSSDQSSMDPAKNGQDVLTAKRNILEVTSSEESKRKTQNIEHRKSGFKIEVSLEDIIKCSKMSRADAARKLEVSISTLKRVCRDYGINRWPPRNMKKVHSSQPLPFGNQEQTPRLSSDLPSNQVSASVAHIKPAVQEEDLMTIRAKYENKMIKFRLSLLSTLVELHQEVAKRLNLEAGSYYVKYKDEEDESILIACNEDFEDFVCHFRSVGKTSIVVQLEPK